MNKYRNLRADHVGAAQTKYLKAKKRIFATQTVCGICGKPVDFSLKFPDPMSASIDHIVPIHYGGDPSDESNLQLTHLICNRLKSDKVTIQNNKIMNKEVIRNDDLPQSLDWMNYKGSYNSEE